MKRMVAFLLLIAMMASMIVVPAYAVDLGETTTAETEQCPCGCGEVLSAVTWQVYDPNTYDAPSSGHYYLDGDYAQTAQYTIMAGDRVVLDLRGYTLTTEGYHRLLLVYGRVHVLDTVGGGRFMAKTSGTAFGGVVKVSTNEVNDALFELCSGTITRDSDNKGSRRGGLIYVTDTATFRMTGGMLLNGTSYTQVYPEQTGSGGCVAAVGENTTVEILGGQIIGGESANFGGNIYGEGTVTLKNCHLIGGTAAQSGGNVYTNGTLTVENCVIESGIANQTDGSGGGNICVTSGGTLFMKDSTVRNGWAYYSGGNVYMGTVSATIENCTIERGVARNRGNNLYGYKTATGLIIRNCQFPGDIAYTGAGLKLEGLVKIGLLNYGLRLRFGDQMAAPLDASGLTEGSEIFVHGKDTITTADANIAYFKGSNRIVVSEGTDGLVATIAASGELGGYCPHCNQRVVWTLFDPAGSLVQECYNDAADNTDTDPTCTSHHLESGHYYVGKSQTSFEQVDIGAYYDLANAKDVVIDMAGYSITAPNRAFYVRGDSALAQQSTLTVLDSYGNSKITGSGTDNQPGGVVYNEGAMVIYGGTWIYKHEDGRNVTGGGVVYNANSLYMHGGTMDGSAFTYTDASTSEVTYSYNGGCVMQDNGAQCNFTMTAGRMLGGTTQAGGCAYLGYNNIVNITGGQFTGGKNLVGSGGNIRMFGDNAHASAELNISGAAIRDGRVEVASVGGGNLSVAYGTVNLSNTYIEGGYSAGYAGNIMTGIKGKITAENCIIEGGYAAAQSGNVHLAATNTTSVWENCLFLNGSGTYGGNMHAGNGYITFRGGKILFGTARTSYGGNISANAGNVSETSKNYTRFEADDNGNAPLIAGGSAKKYGGNLYVGGVVELQAVTLLRGKAQMSGQDLCVAKGDKQSKLTVGPGVTGAFSAAFADELLGQEVYGEPIDRTVCQTLNATVTMEGNYQNALLCAKDGQLYVGAYAVVDGAGNMTWYADADSAMAGCEEGSYVKVYLDTQIKLTKNVALDIHGNAVTVSGAYTVSLMDSKGGGTLALTEGAGTEEKFIAPDGVRYLTKVEGTTATAHPLDMKITGVSLRTSVAGIYYTGSWLADEVTAGLIDSYGVAVSTAGIPDEAFMDAGSKCLWTSQTDVLNAQTNDYSVLIKGIMKTLEEDPDRTAEENRRNGETTIHAVAYVKLKDGNIVLSESVSCSLHDVMGMVDDRILSDSVNYRKYTNPMREFYSKWEDFGMGEWQFNMIQPPVEDDVIDILMIGNSFCFYYVEELVGIAAADGVKMRVCNVYYSGCRLDQHYNWWKAGEAPYQFYETTIEGGRKGTNNVSLEWCLAQGEWDYISLQTPRFNTYDLPTEIERNKLYMDELVGYLRDQFPKTKLAWHQTWTYEIGTAGNGVVTDAESQLNNHTRILNYALYACEEYDLLRINTGDAWKILRDDGYRKLCARIGKGTDHEGDYYHDGDIGGGQYLNACVWYEVITGNSCVGNTYRPVYKYQGEEIPLNSEVTYEGLQEVAHRAVAQMRGEEG